VAVIGEAAAPALYARPVAEVEAVRSRYGLPERYLLWVGGLQAPDPRKRVAALARAVSKLPLVLVGQVGRWARELPDVTLTGVVTDDELAAIFTVDDLDGLIAAAQAVERPAPAPPAWTWEDAAAATWQVYEEAVAGAKLGLAGLPARPARHPASP
jgi:hypothetical protein